MFFRKRPPPSPYVKQDDQNTFRLRVRTQPHGDLVELRFTKSAHIGVDDLGGYIFRKQVVSDPHFDRGEVTVQFDRAYRVKDVACDRVEAIPVKDWD